MKVWGWLSKWHIHRWVFVRETSDGEQQRCVICHRHREIYYGTGH